MAQIHDACRRDGDDTLLSVRVQPGAAVHGPGGVVVLAPRHGGAAQTYVTWRVRARALDGRANAALVRSVADHLGVPAGAIEVAHGTRSRTKTLRVRGRAIASVVAALS